MLLSVLLLALAAIPSAEAVPLSCSVKQGCASGELDVLHMYSPTNAHAELPSGTAYTWKVCCGGPPANVLSSSCTESGSKVVLNLFSTTNSHVEQIGGTYANSVCLNATGGDISCSYSSGSCAAGYTCLASISSQTNAHIADCSASGYNTKVCCSYTDKTAPVTTISQDGTSGWSAQDVSFTLSCTDVGGLCQPSFKIVDATQTCDSSGTTSGTSGTVSCSQGSACEKKVCYYSVDDSGNQETVKTSGIFQIDKSPPVTTDNSDSSWHGSDVDITLTCQDAGLGCKNTSYCVFDDPGTLCTPTILLTTTVKVSCPGTCKKIVRYYSYDTLGNKEAEHNSKTVMIDHSLPSCTIAPLPQYSNSAIINLSWTASSPSPLSNVTLEKNETGQWETVTVIKSSMSGGSYMFNGMDGQSYIFRFVASNVNSQQGYSQEVGTTIDTQPPVNVIVSSPAFANATQFAVSWSGDDSVSGIANYNIMYRNGSGTYALWSNFTQNTKSAYFGQNYAPILPENNRTYSFRLTAYDAAGNFISSNESSTLVDTRMPSCTMNDMPALQSSPDFTISWAGQDGESGIAEFIVEQKNGTGSWAQIYRGTGLSRLTGSLQDGTYYFRCIAVDRAGNSGSLPTAKSTTIDLGAPLAEINFTQYVYPRENLTVDAKVTDATQIGVVRLIYNASVLSAATTEISDQLWTVSWVIPGTASLGSKQFTIYVQDSTGKERYYNMSFTVVEFCKPGEIQSGCSCGTGQRVCNSQGKWDACLNATKTPSTEICDGIDNDCDGTSDNVGGGNSIQSTACRCFNSTLSEMLLNPTVLATMTETCNGIDDDCNGLIDDNGNCCENGKTQPCGGTGSCSGLKTCANGLWGSCVRQVQPTNEICGNGADDNCDGNIDEDCSACTDTDGDGYGSPASNDCTYSGEDCDDSDSSVNPGMTDVCDGIDNDCDGQIDGGIECTSCSNSVQDNGEDGVDCGGNCSPCFVWEWLILSAVGVVILLVLAFVWFRFKQQGRELTWEELKSKWTPHHTRKA